MNHQYAAKEPTRVEIDALTEPAVLEFGAPWCGFCRAAQPLLASAFEEYPAVRHIKIEDGRGHRLGRSFRVKLWPTLIFLRNGEEIERLIRPDTLGSIRKAMKNAFASV